jgi:hypothetical protein
MTPPVWRVGGHPAPMLPTMAGQEVLPLEWVVYLLQGDVPLVRRRRMTPPFMVLRSFWKPQGLVGDTRFYLSFVGRTVTDTTAWIPGYRSLPGLSKTKTCSPPESRLNFLFLFLTRLFSSFQPISFSAILDLPLVLTNRFSTLVSRLVHPYIERHSLTRVMYMDSDLFLSGWTQNNNQRI